LPFPNANPLPVFFILICLGKFKDSKGESCSIQKSSLATAHCIWLGRDVITKYELENDLGVRMHLNIKQVKLLIPLLQTFVETGYLPEGAG